MELALQRDENGAQPVVLHHRHAIGCRLLPQQGENLFLGAGGGQTQIQAEFRALGAQGHLAHQAEDVSINLATGCSPRGLASTSSRHVHTHGYTRVHTLTLSE